VAPAAPAAEGTSAVAAVEPIKEPDADLLTCLPMLNADRLPKMELQEL
jgi:hypothetical protein